MTTTPSTSAPTLSVGGPAGSPPSDRSAASYDYHEPSAGQARTQTRNKR